MRLHAPNARGRMRLRAGYVLMEIVIALGLFSVVAVALVEALNMTSRAASTIRDEMFIEQILRSAMTEALSRPNLEEGTERVDLIELTGDDASDFPGEIETIVEPLDPPLESEEGKLLENMFRIEVIFHWRGADGEWQKQSVETWRYANLYRP